MQWIGLPSSTFGGARKTEGYLRLIDGFFWLQIKIANISFPKILCKPNLTFWNDM